jgi:YVTN family beta-propeller protein
MTGYLLSSAISGRARPPSFVADPCSVSPMRSIRLLRRAAAIIAACIALAAPAGATAKTAIILNSDDDSLSVIDGTTYKETSRVHIGRAPHHLMLTPHQNFLIIAMAEGNELVFIDRKTGILARRLELSDPYQIGFSPDGKWFVANSLRLDRIDIYDATNFKLAHRLPALTMPSHIAFSLDSKTVFVTLQGSDKLTAIDLVSGNVLWTVPVGRQPAGVWMRKSGTLLVAIMGSDHIAEIDPRNGAILRRIETGNGAHNFQISPDGKILYVSNRVAGTISVLDADTLAVKGTLNAPGGPDDMMLTPDGSELWVTGRWRAWVEVIEANSGVLKATIPVGRSPHGIFLY